MSDELARSLRKNEKKRFFVTVEEVFGDTFVIHAKDEAEVRKIINDSISNNYSPVQRGSGYQRHIRIDADE